jgi:hypothetical protein
VDHTPGNVQHMARLARLMPDLRFVHLIRDGRAVAASQIPLDWGSNDVYEAARLWMSKVGLGLAACSALGPRAITVRFEDLVTDPEATLKGLCEFLQIPFDHGMVGRRDFQVPGYSRDQHALVGTAPDETRIDRWRHDLSATQIEAFEFLTGDMLDYLGYSLCNDSPGRPKALAHGRSTSVSFLRKRVTNPVRRRIRKRRGAR